VLPGHGVLCSAWLLVSCMLWGARYFANSRDMGFGGVVGGGWMGGGGGAEYLLAQVVAVYCLTSWESVDLCSRAVVLSALHVVSYCVTSCCAVKCCVVLRCVVFVLLWSRPVCPLVPRRSSPRGPTRAVCAPSWNTTPGPALRQVNAPTARGLTGVWGGCVRV
jgi:hypothetical protein